MVKPRISSYEFPRSSTGFTAEANEAYGIFWGGLYLAVYPSRAAPPTSSHTLTTRPLTSGAQSRQNSSSTCAYTTKPLPSPDNSPPLLSDAGLEPQTGRLSSLRRADSECGVLYYVSCVSPSYRIMILLRRWSRAGYVTLMPRT